MTEKQYFAIFPENNSTRKALTQSAVKCAWDFGQELARNLPTKSRYVHSYAASKTCLEFSFGSFWHFSQSMAGLQPWSVNHFTKIGKRTVMFLTDESSYIWVWLYGMITYIATAAPEPLFTNPQGVFLLNIIKYLVQLDIDFDVSNRSENVKFLRQYDGFSI